ncbi:MAG: Txe/YoeB family addiction module toxin [Ignavibacteriales bacterium]|jgi:toxin YoeB|nr:Txe/YoeB family addiction module toxin [Ignavibacteriales bacterium]
MDRKIILSSTALEDLRFWSKNDPKTIQKIFKLISEIQNYPFEGTGKPEPLKYNLAGCWSRRIDEVNRLVYKVEEESVIILSCKYHY